MPGLSTEISPKSNHSSWVIQFSNKQTGTSVNRTAFFSGVSILSAKIIIQTEIGRHIIDLRWVPYRECQQCCLALWWNQARSKGRRSNSARLSTKTKPNVLNIIIHCVSQETSKTFSIVTWKKLSDSNNFSVNIPDTTCHQMTIQFFISPNVCFCTT